MQCCSISEEEKQQRAMNREINEKLKLDKKITKKEFKVLLLGTGEAGKSTFLKQMRILNGDGFTNEEKEEFKQIVFKNLVQSIQTIIVAMDELYIPYDSDENQDLGNKLMVIDYDAVTTLDEQYLKAMKILWSDNGIQQCYNRRREYQLIDSAWHFLSNINRIGQRDYWPSLEDILICRKMTNSIAEYKFNLGTRIVRMIDVGGQRSERRKWIRCFDDVGLIIFLVAMSEFDQTLKEDIIANRMEESRVLFKHVHTAIWFENSSFVVFLNKKDLLEEKIKYSHLVDYYPEYKGPKHDVKSAREYIRDMFVDNNKHMYSHFTCATDTENIKKVFSTVKITIMQDILGDFTLS